MLRTVMDAEPALKPDTQQLYAPAVAPAPTFAATQAQNQAAMQNYGIQQAGNNSTMQGLTSLGGMAAMYF